MLCLCLLVIPFIPCCLIWCKTMSKIPLKSGYMVFIALYSCSFIEGNIALKAKEYYLSSFLFPPSFQSLEVRYIIQRNTFSNILLLHHYFPYLIGSWLVFSYATTSVHLIILAHFLFSIEKNTVEISEKI